MEGLRAAQEEGFLSKKKMGKKCQRIAGVILMLGLSAGCGRITEAQEDDNHNLTEHTLIKTIWTGKEENIDKAVLENQAASVQVTAGAVSGSGVLWDVRDGKLIVITAAHVLSEAENGTVQFVDGSEAEFSMLYLDVERDVAFLQIDLSDVSDKTCEKARLVSPSVSCYQNMEAETEVGLAGTDEDKPVTSTGTVIDKSWYVADFPIEMLYMKCYAQPGMSGCGIFDAHGHLIGLLSGGNGEESVGVPVTVVEKIYHPL